MSSVLLMRTGIGWRNEGVCDYFLNAAQSVDGDTVNVWESWSKRSTASEFRRSIWIEENRAAQRRSHKTASNKKSDNPLLADIAFNSDASNNKRNRSSDQILLKRTYFHSIRIVNYAIFITFLLCCVYLMIYDPGKPAKSVPYGNVRSIQHSINAVKMLWIALHHE